MLLFLILLEIIFTLDKVSLDEKGQNMEDSILKPSNLAGRWYTSSKNELRREIESYLKNNPSLTTRVGFTRAVILPHAGFRFSGDTIAATLNQVGDLSRFKRIWIIAPSHHQMYRGFSIAHDYTHYHTPLGDVKISKEVVDELKKMDLFFHATEGHQSEHSIEIELPFLQTLLDEEDYEIIPILMGQLKRDGIEKLSKRILELYNPETDLFLISSDFTHFGPNYRFEPFKSNRKENLEKFDFESFKMIEEFDVDGFLSRDKENVQTVCGKIPIALLLVLLLEKKEIVWSTLEKYETSGGQTGDFSNSVSYLGITFHDKERRDDIIVGSGSDDPFTDEEKSFILSTVRNVVTDYLNKDASMRVPALPSAEMQHKFDKVQGCFVTYHKDGQLRGCIGHIFPHEKLYDCIMQNTISAAVRDHRFAPMTYEELMSSDIHIEVSILTDPVELSYATTEELLDQIRENVDGVILRSGRHQSTYLPTVWDQIPDKKLFLSHLCKKGGMDYNCWEKLGNDVLTVSVYQSIVFEE